MKNTDDKLSSCLPPEFRIYLYDYKLPMPQVLQLLFYMAIVYKLRRFHKSEEEK